MSSCCADRLILTPTVLGRDGVLRAFTLVSADRPGLTLAEWVAEAAVQAGRRDRLLGTSSGDIPRTGLVGLIAPTGCLFAVFGYAVEHTPSPMLAVRGPSWNAPMGGRMVPARLEATIARLAADLDCTETRRRPW